MLHTGRQLSCRLLIPFIIWTSEYELLLTPRAISLITLFGSERSACFSIGSLETVSGLRGESQRCRDITPKRIFPDGHSRHWRYVLISCLSPCLFYILSPVYNPISLLFSCYNIITSPQTTNITTGTGSESRADELITDHRAKSPSVPSYSSRWT
jgi:hypothetical protein